MIALQNKPKRCRRDLMKRLITSVESSTAQRQLEDLLTP